MSTSSCRHLLVYQPSLCRSEEDPVERMLLWYSALPCQDGFDDNAVEDRDRAVDKAAMERIAMEDDNASDAALSVHRQCFLIGAMQALRAFQGETAPRSHGDATPPTLNNISVVTLAHSRWAYAEMECANGRGAAETLCFILTEPSTLPSETETCSLDVVYTTLKRRLSYWMHAVEFVTGIATMSGRLVPSQFKVGDGSLPLEVGSGPPLSALFQRHRRHLLLTARRSMMRREDRTRVVPYVDGPANNIWFARTSLLAEQVRQQHRVVEGERGTVIVHRQLVVYTDMPALLSNLALDLVVSARGAPTNGGEDMRNDDEMRVYVPSMDHATMDQPPLVPCKGRSSTRTAYIHWSSSRDTALVELIPITTCPIDRASHDMTPSSSSSIFESTIRSSLDSIERAITQASMTTSPSTAHTPAAVSLQTHDARTGKVKATFAATSASPTHLHPALSMYYEKSSTCVRFLRHHQGQTVSLVHELPVAMTSSGKRPAS